MTVGAINSSKVEKFPHGFLHPLKCTAIGIARAPALPRGLGTVAGLQPLDQFAHRRDEAVGVERIVREAVGVVAGEHELVLDVVGVADRPAASSGCRSCADRPSCRWCRSSFCAQLENWQAERQPMQLIWSVRISCAFSGVTKIRVESGVRIASVKPCGYPASARARGRAASDRRCGRARPPAERRQ